MRPTTAKALIVRHALLCAAAILITSCGTATFTKTGSDATIESLRSFHLAFIDEFAVPGKKFNATAFNAKVNEGNAKFQQAIADEKFTARRPVLVDFKAQFDADAAHLRSKASRGEITPALATEMKKDVNKVYEHALGNGRSHALGPGRSPEATAIPQYTPWPPPLASAVEVLPRKLLVAEKGSGRLEDVNARLTSAFEQCGYSDRTYYSVPGGFAIASRIEQINKDGSPSRNRWSLVLPYMEELSIKAYLRALFKAPVGHYRVIVFVVTPYSFSQTKTEMSASEAEALVSHGTNALPEQIGHREYLPEYDCTALIYEFRKTGHKAEFVRPSEISSHMHLQNAGLLAALSQPRS